MKKMSLIICQSLVVYTETRVMNYSLSHACMAAAVNQEDLDLSAEVALK